MDPISLISGGLGLLSGIAGGIIGSVNAAKQAKLANDQLHKQEIFNNSLFQRQYYQDALSRHDTQNLLRRLRNNMRDISRLQNNTAIITGQTPEAVAATKEANAKAYADAIASIDATNSQRKDAALAQYQTLRNNSYANWVQQNLANAQNWTNFASQAFNTGVNSIDTFANAFDKTKKNDNTQP